MTKLAMLTIGTNEYCERIVHGLANAHIIPDAICVAERSKPALSKQLKTPGKFFKNLSAQTAKRIFPSLQSNQAPEDHWQGCAGAIRKFEKLNSPQAASFLKELAPDYLILAGSGIIKENILKIPAQGTFNVHPGLLPWIRGVGVIERAMERNYPVGLTAHYVDPGIDTGNIIYRELVYIHKNDTLSSIRRRAEFRCAQVMVALVVKACRDGKPASLVQQKEKFPYCNWLTSEEKKQVEELVKTGRALERYIQWHAYLGSDILPNEHLTAPPTDATAQELP